MCCKWAHSTPNVWRQIFSLSKFVCEILRLEEVELINQIELSGFVDRWSLIVPTIGVPLRNGHVRKTHILLPSVPPRTWEFLQLSWNRSLSTDDETHWNIRLNQAASWNEHSTWWQPDVFASPLGEFRMGTGHWPGRQSVSVQRRCWQTCAQVELGWAALAFLRFSDGLVFSSQHNGNDSHWLYDTFVW